MPAVSTGIEEKGGKSFREKKMSLPEQPRKLGGGRSERYEERRGARCSRYANAPEWGDAAAAAVFKGIHGLCDSGVGITAAVQGLLSNSAERTAFVRALPVGPFGRANADEVMDWHAERYSEAENLKEQKQKARSFLGPLRKRAHTACATPGVLELPRMECGERTFHEFLSADPERTDRLRDIRASARSLEGIKRWPLGWLVCPGAVCYERMAARIAKERSGKADARFMRGIVKTQTLPTAVANASDHYILVTSEGEARYFSVNEVARTFGVPEAGSLYRMLTKTEALTPNQAVECLGRSVHVGVARSILRELGSRGLLPQKPRYGSAYSGIDTFAAAMEAEFGDEWTYEFASESDRIPRKGRHPARGTRGIAARRVRVENDAAHAWARRVHLAEAREEAVLVLYPIDGKPERTGPLLRGVGVLVAQDGSDPKCESARSAPRRG